MLLTDNKRLFDLSTRTQIYVEGVKVQFAREFNFVLADLKNELVGLLSRINYKTLDGLTKAELNSLIISLRKSQSKIYSEYTEQILKQLRLFMNRSLEVNRRVYTSDLATNNEESKKEQKITIFSDNEAIKFIKEKENNGFAALFGIASITGNNDRLWSIVTNNAIPANGLFLLPFIKTFATSAQANIENGIRKAYVNGLTVEETVKELTGDNSKQGSSSQLQKVGVQASAVTATMVQHVAAIVAAAVTSSLFDYYEWVSVLDNRTTEICISRDGKRYQYGKGPLPPAHIRCRSHITPIVGKDPIPQETLRQWASRQPTDIQDDVELFKDNKPLTVEKFRSKVSNILSR